MGAIRARKRGGMKYMCLIFEAADPNGEFSPEEGQKQMDAYAAFTKEWLTGD